MVPEKLIADPLTIEAAPLMATESELVASVSICRVEVAPKVRSPVRLSVPMPLPGARMPATVTALPAPMLTVPLPWRVWALPKLKEAFDVRSRTALVDVASPTTTVAELAIVPAEERARVPPLIVVVPV